MMEGEDLGRGTVWFDPASEDYNAAPAAN